MEEKTNDEIKEQIEYYLSDKNLEGDQFFHDLISKDKEGYLDLDYILQCNKVKKNNWTKEQMINSLKKSEKIELNENLTKIRRKNNQPLPPLDENKLLLRKRNRTKNNNTKKQPIIISISSDKETSIKAEDIESKFKYLNPNLSILFTIFNKKEGHLAFISSEENTNIKNTDEKDEKEQPNINFVKTLDIDGNILKLYLCEGKELENFMEENKAKIEECLNKTKSKKNKKKKKKSSSILKENVILGGEEYNDIGVIKEKIKKIMDDAKEKMIVLDEEKTNFIKDLVKFHPDKNIRKKTEEIPFIGVGRLNENEPKRGFFGLDENKKKQYDFLIYKCPERIMTEDRKK